MFHLRNPLIFIILQEKFLSLAVTRMKIATLCYVKDTKAKKTLMLHRIKKQNDVHQGKWNGLGGKFDPGETPEECVIREVLEESGLSITSPVMNGFITFPEFKDGEDLFVFVFTADTCSGSLIDSSEGELQWIDDAELLNLNLWEGDAIFMKWIDEKKFFSARFVYKEGRLVDHSAVMY